MFFCLSFLFSLSLPSFSYRVCVCVPFRLLSPTYVPVFVRLKKKPIDQKSNHFDTFFYTHIILYKSLLARLEKALDFFCFQRKKNLYQLSLCPSCSATKLGCSFFCTLVITYLALFPGCKSFLVLSESQLVRAKGQRDKLCAIQFSRQQNKKKKAWVGTLYPLPPFTSFPSSLHV